MRALTVVVLLTVAACSYKNRPVSGEQTCATSGDQICPADYRCILGRCWEEGTGPETRIDSGAPTSPRTGDAAPGVSVATDGPKIPASATDMAEAAADAPRMSNGVDAPGTPEDLGSRGDGPTAAMPSDGPRPDLRLTPPTDSSVGCTGGEERPCALLGCPSGGIQRCESGRFGACRRTCAEGGLKGPCTTGIQTCDGAGWSACSIAPATADTCVPDNDANCNGTKNEGCACATGATRKCSDGGLFGSCASGTQTCANGTWGVCSIAPAGSDTCDMGNDDNCNDRKNEGCACINGRVDSCGVAVGAKGSCKDGTSVCATGRWGACSVVPAAKDLCVAGDDATCNGTINEGCPCVTGNTRPCTQGGLFGKCSGGIQICTAGSWGSCSITPSAADTCDMGNDDTCNDQKNEGCACINSRTETCGVALGARGSCKDGTTSCTNGRWGACSVTPAAKDLCVANNDATCNGMVTEGCPCLTGDTRFCSQGGLPGKCSGGIQTCNAGTWGSCSITPSAKDTCEPDNDDTCDGAEGSGCVCVNTRTKPCGSCGRVQVCANAQWGPCPECTGATDLNPASPSGTAYSNGTTLATFIFGDAGSQDASRYANVIMTFDLSAIPAGATVTMAELKVYQSSCGSSETPYTALGGAPILDHIKDVANLNSAALNAVSLASAATGWIGATATWKVFDMRAWVQADLNARASRNNRSQIRLRFPTNTNGDAVDNRCALGPAAPYLPLLQLAYTYP